MVRAVGKGGICWKESRMDVRGYEVLRLEWDGVGSLAGDGGLAKPGCPLDKGGVASTHSGLLLAHP